VDRRRGTADVGARGPGKLGGATRASQTIGLSGADLRSATAGGDAFGARRRPCSAPAQGRVAADRGPGRYRLSHQVVGARLSGLRRSGQWPFAAIAAAAARENPDLVIHVGDYHYRESACPQDQPCANSAWGYGWDAWNADFFVPARPLLQAAPWVVVRGNHEECARAGQGWFRLLDARPYDAQRSCDESHNDAEANFSDPYAVPLGSHWQLIVFDSALASKPLNLGKSADLRRLARYRENMLVVDALASAPGMHSIFVSHHPVLGFTVKASRIQFGNQALLDAMKLVNGSRYFPPGVEASLHGHVHSFEAINFSSGHPAALVAGHGGDNLDTELSDSIGTAYPSAEAVRIDSVAHAHSFGYLLLERGTNGWTVSARRRDGSTLTVCTLRGTHLACGAGVASVHPGGHG
jgi:hypothetical protein